MAIPAAGLGVAALVRKLIGIAKSDPLQLKELIARSPRLSKFFNVDYDARTGRRIREAKNKAFKQGTGARDARLKKGLRKLPEGTKRRTATATKRKRLGQEADKMGRQVYDDVYDIESKGPRLIWDDLGERVSGRWNQMSPRTRDMLGTAGRWGAGGTAFGLGAGMLGGDEPPARTGGVDPELFEELMAMMLAQQIQQQQQQQMQRQQMQQQIIGRGM